MSYMGLLFLILCVGVIVTLIVLGITGSNNETKTVGKTLFKVCKNNFDCENGFICETRDHPSDGLCVIAPGGACHKAPGNKNDACYSGFYCDTQDGTCLQKEN